MRSYNKYIKSLKEEIAKVNCTLDYWEEEADNAITSENKSLAIKFINQCKNKLNILNTKLNNVIEITK